MNTKTCTPVQLVEIIHQQASSATEQKSAFNKQHSALSPAKQSTTVFTVLYFLDYRSLQSISHMPTKCVYFPRKSIHKSPRCISRTDQQTCSAVYRPKQWCGTLCRRRVSGEIDWRVVPRISAVTHITDWLAVSSRLPHAELAADTDNCCRKHQYSRHSSYPHCSCTPLPLCTEPHLKSPVTVMVSLRLWWSGPPNARRSATAHFPWQLHVPGTASRQLSVRAVISFLPEPLEDMAVWTDTGVTLTSFSGCTSFRFLF